MSTWWESSSSIVTSIRSKMKSTLASIPSKDATFRALEALKHKTHHGIK